MVANSAIVTIDGLKMTYHMYTGDLIPEYCSCGRSRYWYEYNGWFAKDPNGIATAVAKCPYCREALFDPDGHAAELAAKWATMQFTCGCGMATYKSMSDGLRFLTGQPQDLDVPCGTWSYTEKNPDLEGKAPEGGVILVFYKPKTLDNINYCPNCGTRLGPGPFIERAKAEEG